ncbi:MAG: 3-methyl-2-oxobutanoate hydroxymethyltransferase [Phycisphaeraceae bacterium]|nr:3-methyl-2-oxobutanoate hydroxymethyltransferase [Phycisphaeraceae bacterium]
MPTARITIATIRKMAQAGEPFASLTCYDATTARWLTRAGVHVLLVGDTAAETVFGFARTLDCPLEPLLALTAGVRRGAESAFEGAPAPEARVPLVMGDMPFMSYQARADDAVRNAGRFLTEGLADAVKLEVDESLAPVVERMVRAGVPICAHVGSRPQRSAVTGGYASAGRTDAEARQIIADARAMIDAGCPMLLVEAVPQSVTAELMTLARAGGRTVPVIGIGAGPRTDGQVLVLNDLVGLTDKPPPFVRPLASLGPAIEDAGRQWVRIVAQRAAGDSPYQPRPAAAHSKP